MNSDFRDQVAEYLRAFTSAQRPLLASIDAAELVDAMDRLLASGKRLRPAFAYAGYLACGGTPSSAVVQACASLELLQACALIHDDVMDASDTRRGLPSTHRYFEQQATSWPGNKQAFGVGAAILVGDLALSWTDEMLAQSGLNEHQLQRARPMLDVMRTELMAGQYLDLVEAVRSDSDVHRAMRVAQYKSAKYTVERPLHLGAAIADASASQIGSLSEYGLAIGVAFQLRDDLLGVFGDPSTTGKPVGDDLREGKRTLLIALALQKASTETARLIEGAIGVPDLTTERISQVQQVLRPAAEEVEAKINELHSQALTALSNSELTKAGQDLLRDLAEAAVSRSH